jgi:hypothetical protein
MHAADFTEVMIATLLRHTSAHALSRNTPGLLGAKLSVDRLCYINIYIDEKCIFTEFLQPGAYRNKFLPPTFDTRAF